MRCCRMSNYPAWSPIPDALFKRVADNDLEWRIELPRGVRILRYSPPNDFGVLDYVVLNAAGKVERTMYMRLIPNDETTMLVAHYVREPDVSETFRSDVEWFENDLRAIASSIEVLSSLTPPKRQGF